MLSKTFQNYFKTKNTTQANKKTQPRPKNTPSPKMKTCNTSCYYLSSLKKCKKNVGSNLNKEQQYTDCKEAEEEYA